MRIGNWQRQPALLRKAGCLEESPADAGDSSGCNPIRYLFFLGLDCWSRFDDVFDSEIAPATGNPSGCLEESPWMGISKAATRPVWQLATRVLQSSSRLRELPSNGTSVPLPLAVKNPATLRVAMKKPQRLSGLLLDATKE